MIRFGINIDWWLASWELDESEILILRFIGRPRESWRAFALRLDRDVTQVTSRVDDVVKGKFLSAEKLPSVLTFWKWEAVGRCRMFSSHTKHFSRPIEGIHFATMFRNMNVTVLFVVRSSNLWIQNWIKMRGHGYLLQIKYNFRWHGDPSDNLKANGMRCHWTFGYHSAAV